MTKRLIPLLAGLLLLLACNSHRKPPQPGLYNSRAEAQVEVDKVNALTQKQRRELKALGVHDQYLPCGTAKPIATPTGYWLVGTDKTGCPPTAGEEDPDPIIPRTKAQPQSGGLK